MRETLRFLPENDFLLLQDPNKYAGIFPDDHDDPSQQGSRARNDSFFHGLNARDVDTLAQVALEEGGPMPGIFGTRMPVSVHREFISGFFRSAFRAMYEDMFGKITEQASKALRFVKRALNAVWNGDEGYDATGRGDSTAVAAARAQELRDYVEDSTARRPPLNLTHAYLPPGETGRKVLEAAMKRHQTRQRDEQSGDDRHDEAMNSFRGAVKGTYQRWFSRGELQEVAKKFLREIDVKREVRTHPNGSLASLVPAQIDAALPIDQQLGTGILPAPDLTALTQPVEGDFDLDLKGIFTRALRHSDEHGRGPFSLADTDWLLRYRKTILKLRRLGIHPDQDPVHLDFYCIVRDIIKRRDEWRLLEAARRDIDEKGSGEGRAANEHASTKIATEGERIFQAGNTMLLQRLRALRNDGSALTPLSYSEEPLQIEPQDAFRSLCVEAEMRAAELKQKIARKRAADTTKFQKLLLRTKMKKMPLHQREVAKKGMKTTSPRRRLTSSRSARQSQQRSPSFSSSKNSKQLDDMLFAAHIRCEAYWSSEAPMIQDTWMLIRNDELTREFLELWTDFLLDRKLLLQMPFTDQTALGLLVRALDLKSGTFPGIYDTLEPGHLAYGTCPRAAASGLSTSRRDELEIESQAAPENSRSKLQEHRLVQRARDKTKRNRAVWKIVRRKMRAKTSNASGQQEEMICPDAEEVRQIEPRLLRDDAPRNEFHESNTMGKSESVTTASTCPVPYWVAVRRNEGLHGIGNRLKTLGKLTHEIRRTRRRLERRRNRIFHKVDEQHQMKTTWASKTKTDSSAGLGRDHDDETYVLIDNEEEDAREGGMYLTSWRDTSSQDINSKTAGKWWMYD
ncbi:unnamed protein product [Amoebophrya sp. A25]|nr:unnamed protein product [Amoebophrya sp. A25]|eukprot:GSA25T00013602001.1